MMIKDKHDFLSNEAKGTGLFRWLFLSFFLLSLTLPAAAWADNQGSLLFQRVEVLNDLPNKSVQDLYQDRDGYLWVATRNGLFRYDGYSLEGYKSTMHRPHLLTDNNVFCVEEDGSHRLWIGTKNGLSVLDKQTGVVRKYGNDRLNSGGVSALLVTRDNRVLVGTERGLYEYLEEEDGFRRMDGSLSGGVFNAWTIKALLEDDRGDVWIGTWSEGLYRQEKKTGRFFAYPRMNALNSAHVLFQDSRKRIWVGSWGYGLHLLHRPYEPERVSWTTFAHRKEADASLSDNLVYAISEDKHTHTLWVGTRSALSLLPLDGKLTADAHFQNCYADGEERSIAGSEVAALLCDRQGLMWIGMIGGGVNKVDTRKSEFAYHPLSEVRQRFHSASVRSLLKDQEGNLWMGLGTYGFGRISADRKRFLHYTDMPEFASFDGISSVMHLMQSPSTGHIWIGVYNRGLFEYDAKAPVDRRVKFYKGDTPWMCGDCVYHMLEDRQGTLWIATRSGLSGRTADGKAVRLDSLVCKGRMLGDMIVVSVAEGAPGVLWAATESDGVLRIEGKGSDWRNYKVTGYDMENGKLSHNHATCILVDSMQRVWVGTGSSGLNLYNPVEDAFAAVHESWNLPGDEVVCMAEDRNWKLWVGTNVGLLKLSVSGDAEHTSFRLYTTADGLQDNIIHEIVLGDSRAGEMILGGQEGLNDFYPERHKENAFSSVPVVTDLRVFNRSWTDMSEEERRKISPLAPRFAQEVVLDYRQNNFAFEFSSLEFANPQRNVYAYKLEGFDENWQYTDASKRFAYYNNLQAGRYTFFLRSTNSNGIWNNETHKVQVTVLPPPWKTWWAYLLYIVAVMGAVWYAYRVARNRMRLQNALHLREVEKEKAEELNHAKLQFFTNITHELLTPLTILSASVDDLKQKAPAYQDEYGVMTHNIRRLIRLLQQILEFRKAETGNLKLRVSPGDLAQFVNRSLESFRPLMHKKNIHFSCVCRPEVLQVWFDADKMDKVLYNLLSNAAKYSFPGETVEVELLDNGDGRARLTVKDTGPGMSKEMQKNLFKRFYEGSYRKFNTIGTGIGLSLVHDLVVLHHGTVTVESEEGKGTAFVILFPMMKEAYAAEEQDVAEVKTGVPEWVADEKADPVEQTGSDAAPAEGESAADRGEGAAERLLLVEDNEELLELMVKLLRHEYQVCTATNGAEALAVLEKQEIDLIVSDVMMPVMDGIELCRKVKGRLETSHIPLILLTAKNQEEDRVEAYESGADAFISKPFSLSVLHARIDNLLRSRQKKRKDFKNQLVFEAKELDYTSIDEEFLKQAVDCVNRHLDHPDFDLACFLEEMHTTKSTCFRKLKSLTGLTFVSFVRNIRMKAACRIMEEKKRIRISELAYAVGYNDPHYFSSSFKKEMGMQPSEYMERFTQGGDVIED